MDKIKKYKIGLSLLAGTVCLAVGLYAPIMSSLLLTEVEHPFTVTNWALVGLGILFLWGRIVAVAKALQNGVSSRINK